MRSARGASPPPPADQVDDFPQVRAPLGPVFVLDAARTYTGARRVVVVRCRSRDDPGNRLQFLLAAERAFGVSDEGLDWELAACLLVAFYKLGRRPLE